MGICGDVHQRMKFAQMYVRSNRRLTKIILKANKMQLDTITSMRSVHYLATLGSYTTSSH